MKLIKIAVILLVLGSFKLNAQPNPPGSGNPAPLPGLAFLAVAGAAFGAKKYHEANKEK